MTTVEPGTRVGRPPLPPPSPHERPVGCGKQSHHITDHEIHNKDGSERHTAVLKVYLEPVDVARGPSSGSDWLVRSWQETALTKRSKEREVPCRFGVNGRRHPWIATQAG